MLSNRKHKMDFLNLSDEVLLEEVFPRLPNSELVRLCQVHPKFRNICNMEELWQIKVRNEYPNFIRVKPTGISWKDFYLTMYQTRDTPVYIDGDIRTYLKLNQYTFDYQINELYHALYRSIRMTIGYSDIFNNLYLSFLGETLTPIAITKYPTIQLNYFPGKTPEDLNNITKIVTSAGTLRTTEGTVLNIEQNLNFRNAAHYVYFSLTPPHSTTIPVYGFILEDKTLYVVDKVKGIHAKCRGMQQHVINNLLHSLRVSAPDIIPGSNVISNDILNDLEIPPDLHYYQQQWSASSYAPGQQCRLVQKVLARIGHLHRATHEELELLH